MKSVKVTRDQMGRRMARFKDLKSYQYQQEAANAIPIEVMERIAAHRVYPVMCPETYSGRSAQAPIKGAPGIVLSIAECPPGDGPAMHIHSQTIRLFVIIHVQTAEQGDRIGYQPELRDEIERKHGRKTVEALDRIGIRFDAGVDA
jgi:hypothetical protein